MNITQERAQCPPSVPSSLGDGTPSTLPPREGTPSLLVTRSLTLSPFHHPYFPPCPWEQNSVFLPWEKVRHLPVSLSKRVPFPIRPFKRAQCRPPRKGVPSPSVPGRRCFPPLPLGGALSPPLSTREYWPPSQQDGAL